MFRKIYSTSVWCSDTVFYKRPMFRKIYSTSVWYSENHNYCSDPAAAAPNDSEELMLRELAGPVSCRRGLEQHWIPLPPITAAVTRGTQRSRDPPPPMQSYSLCSSMPSWNVKYLCIFAQRKQILYDYVCTRIYVKIICVLTVIHTYSRFTLCSSPWSAVPCVPFMIHILSVCYQQLLFVPGKPI